MRKFLIWFFVVLGVVFFLLILVVATIYMTDGYGIRSFITNGTSNFSPTGTATQIEDKNPLLSESQEQILEKIGVDPAALPKEITPEMVVCFEEKLGKERTDEIRNGDSPTAVDYAKANGCF